MQSVFERQTDGLQYAKGVALSVWVCTVFWGLVLTAFWWSSP